MTLLLSANHGKSIVQLLKKIMQQSLTLYVAGLVQTFNPIVFFLQAEDGIRDYKLTGVQTCALPILGAVEAGPPTAVETLPVDADAQVDAAHVLVGGVHEACLDIVDRAVGGPNDVIRELGVVRDHLLRREARDEILALDLPHVDGRADSVHRLHDDADVPLAGGLRPEIRVASRSRVRTDRAVDRIARMLRAEHGVRDVARDRPLDRQTVKLHERRGMESLAPGC